MPECVCAEWLRLKSAVFVAFSEGLAASALAQRVGALLYGAAFLRIRGCARDSIASPSVSSHFFLLRIARIERILTTIGHVVGKTLYQRRPERYASVTSILCLSKIRNWQTPLGGDHRQEALQLRKRGLPGSTVYDLSTGRHPRSVLLTILGMESLLTNRKSNNLLNTIVKLGITPLRVIRLKTGSTIAQPSSAGPGRN
jgi:hypothetical protein